MPNDALTLTERQRCSAIICQYCRDGVQVYHVNSIPQFGIMDHLGKREEWFHQDLDKRYAHNRKCQAAELQILVVFSVEKNYGHPESGIQ